MAEIIRSVKGTRDFYPDEMARRQWLLGQIRETSELFGYQYYDGPCLESIELYAAKSGEELVKEQSFVFPDRSGDLIALRPELTPTLARMVAQKQNELFFPQRWWSFGPFWRYERPQKGRTREFFQWNIDLIGADSLLADAELIALAASFLQRVGLSPDQVSVRVNHRAFANSQLMKLGLNPDQVKEMLRLIDRIDKLPPEIWKEKVLELGIDTLCFEQIQALLADLSLWEESEQLRGIFQHVQHLGLGEYICYDPSITRGLDYYTGTVFEVHDNAGEFRAILGGGHYGNLVADVGGRELAGVGFAMGDVVIDLVLQKFNAYPQELLANDGVFVTIFDEELHAKSELLAAKLRGAGIKTVLPVEIEKLGKQLKYADRVNMRFVLVLGPDEAKAGKVMVKDLVKRDQTLVGEEDLISFLKSAGLPKA
jgi:histidyl-tRNA synthetase